MWFQSIEEMSPATTPFNSEKQYISQDQDVIPSMLVEYLVSICYRTVSHLHCLDSSRQVTSQSDVAAVGCYSSQSKARATVGAGAHSCQWKLVMEKPWGWLEVYSNKVRRDRALGAKLRIARTPRSFSELVTQRRHPPLCKAFRIPRGG